MIPSELFHDLLDKNVAFKIVQRNLNGPDYEFNVPRARNGLVELKAKGCDPLAGTSNGILGRINHLMCQNPGREAVDLKADYLSLDTGLCINFKIVPEPGRGRQAGFPAEIQIEGTVLYGDYPTAAMEIAVISVFIEKRERLYLTELVGDGLHERFRISHRSIPKDLHAKMAAAGFLEDSFIELHGMDALKEAEEGGEQQHRAWIASLIAMKGRLTLR